MSRLLAGVAVVSLMCGSLAWLSDPQKRPQQRPEKGNKAGAFAWHTDLQKATKLAAKTGKPLLVAFR